MAQSSFVLLNCGSSHLGGAVVTRTAGGIRIDDTFREDLALSPADDEAWPGAVAEALGRLKAARKLAGPVLLAAPGSQVLVKLLKVPSVAPERRRDAVAHEFQNGLPPLAEMAWDFHVVADDGVESEVAAVAIRDEAATRLAGIVSAAGLQPAGLAAAPLLDVNAWRHAHPGDPEPAVLVHVGARTTNVVFLAPGGFVVRNIPLGGANLTQAVADTIGASFGAAEDLKVGFFSGTRQIAESDATAGILRTQAQAFLRRLGTELTRSLVAYRRAHPESAPVKAAVTGRGALLPGLPEFLSEKLGVGVTFFDPLASFELSPAVESRRAGTFHEVSELAGLAATLVDGGESVRVDLTPSRLRAAREASKSRPFLVAAAAALVVGTFLPGIRWTLDAASSRELAATAEERARPLGAISAELAVVTADVEAARLRLSQVEGLVSGKANWIEFLADLQSRLAAVEDVWLESLVVERPEADPADAPPVDPMADPSEPPPVAEAPPFRLRLAGRMIDRENPVARVSAAVQRRVQRLLTSFEGSPFVAAVADSRFDASENGILRFEFTLVVNPDKPL